MNDPKVKPINVCPDDLYSLQLAENTYKVYCCREWEVTPLFHPGKCGLCHKTPERKSG